MHYKILVLAKNSCAAGEILKNTGQKEAFLGTFLENFTKKLFFFSARAPHSKLVLAPLANFLGFVTKNGYLKII